MEKHSYCVIVFPDSRAAIRAQKALEQAGMPAPVMPTPRELTARCGLSLRCPPEALERSRRGTAFRSIAWNMTRTPAP